LVPDAGKTIIQVMISIAAFAIVLVELYNPR